MTSNIIPNIISNDTPIYLIIAHSEITFWINKNPYNKKKEIDPVTYFNVPENNYLIYTTPCSTWSMLYEDYTEEDKNHILNKSYNEIKSNLISPKLSSYEGNRIELLITDMNYVKTIPKTSKIYNESKILKPGFFLSNEYAFNKTHQFFGDTLTGYNFGIIKLMPIENYNTRNSIKTSVDILKKYKIPTKPKDETKDKKKVPYFISNTELTEKDKELNKLIVKRSLKKEEISIDEIMNLGENGIYISLSCSELGLYMRNVVREASRKIYDRSIVNVNLIKTEENIENFDLQIKLDNLIIDNFTKNNILWDKYILEQYKIYYNLNKSKELKNIKSLEIENISKIYFWYSPRLEYDDNGWLSREKRKKIGLKPKTRQQKKV